MQTSTASQVEVSPEVYFPLSKKSLPVEGLTRVSATEEESALPETHQQQPDAQEVWAPQSRRGTELEVNNSPFAPAPVEVAVLATRSPVSPPAAAEHVADADILPLSRTGSSIHALLDASAESGNLEEPTTSEGTASSEGSDCDQGDELPTPQFSSDGPPTQKAKAVAKVSVLNPLLSIVNVNAAFLRSTISNYTKGVEYAHARLKELDDKAKEAWREEQRVEQQKEQDALAKMTPEERAKANASAEDDKYDADKNEGLYRAMQVMDNLELNWSYVETNGKVMTRTGNKSKSKCQKKKMQPMRTADTNTNSSEEKEDRMGQQRSLQSQLMRGRVDGSSNHLMM